MNRSSPIWQKERERVSAGGNQPSVGRSRGVAGHGVCGTRKRRLKCQANELMPCPQGKGREDLGDSAQPRGAPCFCSAPSLHCSAWTPTMPSTGTSLPDCHVNLYLFPQIRGSPTVIPRGWSGTLSRAKRLQARRTKEGMGEWQAPGKAI